jgi:hypothetical protein
MRNDRPTPQEHQQPEESRGKGGFRFIGLELTIFSAAVLVFVIAIIVILFFALSR